MRSLLQRAAREGLRCFSSQAEQPVAHSGFIELREYTLKPEGIKEFMQLTERFMDLRKQLLPFLGMWTCDTGGVLNRVLHLYNYDDLDQRDKSRAAAAASEEWQQQYLAHSRRTVERQESTIFEPTAKVLEAAGALRLADFRCPPRQPGGPQPIYELRRFLLQPGYDGLPLLTAAYQRGIRHKLQATKDRGQLLFFGHSDVGLLNQVIELWRWESAQASFEARKAARDNPEWRATVAAVSTGVQRFTTSYLHSLPFSPLQ